MASLPPQLTWGNGHCPQTPPKSQGGSSGPTRRTHGGTHPLRPRCEAGPHTPTQAVPAFPALTQQHCGFQLGERPELRPPPPPSFVIAQIPEPESIKSGEVCKGTP